jgi:hypothetical protein
VQERPGQTLQATALVHEAYVRLMETDKPQHWNSQGHFFAAAAEAMRRILIDRAREKQAGKRGGKQKRVDFDEAEVVASAPPEAVLALDDALARLSQHDRLAGELVKLRLLRWSFACSAKRPPKPTADVCVDGAMQRMPPSLGSSKGSHRSRRWEDLLPHGATARGIETGVSNGKT